jgi:hypothetical protein
MLLGPCFGYGTVSQHFVLQHRPGTASSKLSFQHNGQDLTCLDQRATQHQLDQKLKSDLLVSAAFHSQADITSLLEVQPVELSLTPFAGSKEYHIHQ